MRLELRESLAQKEDIICWLFPLLAGWVDPLLMQVCTAKMNLSEEVDLEVLRVTARQDQCCGCKWGL